jgi:hypothetical protein
MACDVLIRFLLEVGEHLARGLTNVCFVYSLEIAFADGDFMGPPRMPPIRTHTTVRKTVITKYGRRGR